MEHQDLNSFLSPQKKLEEEKQNAEVVAGLLEKNGLAFEEISFPENSAYTKAFILKKENRETEETVRVYRGINNLDETLIDQTPYIDRFEQYNRLDTKTKSQIDASMETLCNNTTYASLLAHIERITPYLTDGEKRETEAELALIQQSIMDGFSARRSLHQKQIAHPMGSSTFGLSPYLSTTYKKDVVYAGTSILVLDVPIGQMEDWSADNDEESNYKGKLNPKHIAAILVTAKYDPFVYRKRPHEESVATLEKVEKILPEISVDTMKIARQKHHEEIVRSDTQNAITDKELVIKNVQR